MAETITIKTAEYSVSRDDVVFRTGSVGSCLAIILYDPDHRVGGMAHAMLSSHKGSPEDVNTSNVSPAKYIDTAIDRMIAEIVKLGGDQSKLNAKLVGGATMFKNIIQEGHSIGTQNILFAREYLGRLGVPIVSEDTGGSIGRIVEFSLSNAVVGTYLKL